MKRRDIVLLVLFVPCVALVILFGFGLIPLSDERLGALLKETIPRLAAGGYLVLFMILKGFGEAFRPKWVPLHLLWALPCFAVAAANFPYTALIAGRATIEQAELIPLFLLKCFGIALLEESFFRALLVPLLEEKGGRLFSVLVSAVLFGAMHLFNLINGDIGAVFLQVGYTFLLGCMFAVMLLFTKNIWLCVAVHFLFDVGGTIVTDLGQGPFQDTVFWCLTAVFGVLCTVHILITLFRMRKK